MLVQELKEYSSLPVEFLELLPEYCLEENCNAPMGITETLTSLYCTNPRCPSKVSVRITSLCKSLNIKGIGESMARRFIDKFGITNPLQIFMYEPSDGEFTWECSMDVSQKLYTQIQANKEFTLPEYIIAAQLPDVQSTAYAIFDGYNSLESAYKDIEEGGVDFIKRKLKIGQGNAVDTKSMASNYYMEIVNNNSMDELQRLSGVLEIENSLQLFNDIKEKGSAYIEDLLNRRYNDTDNTVSIRAIKVYNSLMTYKEDFFECLEYVVIKDTSQLEHVNLVISTSVGAPFGNKKEFVNYINTTYGEYVHINYKNSVTNDTDFLIWSGTGAPTTKVRKARDINSRRSEENQIPILTGQEFDELCRKEFLE